MQPSSRGTAPDSAGLPLDEVPEGARNAWLRLRDELQAILGEDLVAMWAYGGTIAPERPLRRADLDTHVIVKRRPDERSAQMIDDAHAAIAREHDVEWDAWYIAVQDARRPESPPHAFRDGRRDTAWALHRSHWLAGKYVHLYGLEPAKVVPEPSWPELEADLDRELEHVERHLVEGDTDPYEASYAILNGSRILHSIETRNAALSKRAAGTWALEHLPARWHPAIRAADRAYDGRANNEEVELLAAEMGPFVAMVRERLPAHDGRSPEAIPRWSGY
jgi:hypothetical protein